jgi:hypothetical protein
VTSSDVDKLRDGCGREGATETLWTTIDIGLMAVHVHRDRDCANGWRERMSAEMRRRYPDETRLHNIRFQELGPAQGTIPVKQEGDPT